MGTRNMWGKVAANLAVRAMTVAAIIGAGTVAAAAATPTRAAAQGPTVYQLSLGDSLAAGVGASTPANSYVSLVASHESSRFSGLTVENLSCGGATTTTMLNGGGGCSYTAGTQLAQAESFLQAHPGQVPYITIDIGANNVDDCLTSGSISITCVLDGLSTIQSELPQIVAGLEAAAPGVPIFGMDYYDPFLQQWLLGSNGQNLARESAELSAILNGDITTIYANNGAYPVDVQGTFAVQDFALTGSFDGQVVPENVSRTCAWTHMCDPVAGGGYAEDIHANDTGHAKIAGDFDQTADRHFRGGGFGTWLATAAGAVIPFGNAGSFGSMAGMHLNNPIVSFVATTDAGGYWLVSSDGGVFAFGDAGFYGSMGGIPLNAPVVGLVATPDDHGYWLVAADGGIFAFGDAVFLGSMGGKPLNKPVVGIASSGSGNGYWLVASDGGIFAFGDANFQGSMGGQPLNRPVVGVAPTVDGNGYWLVASDGGIFAFGDADFYGSTGGIPLNQPVIGMAVTPDGGGYWLGAADGGVFAFGRAHFNGSSGGKPPGSPVVSIATN